ncbi:MAG: hypothetical protein IJR89_08555 [Clostridia bacterium]|nr:hypothetical protein [Clostridia bacterium]
MKRFIVMLLIALILITACAKTEKLSEKVLQINQESYSEPQGEQKNRSVFPLVAETEIFMDSEKLGKTVNFSFLGKQYEGKYCRSFRYNLYSISVDSYILNGINEEKESVLLLPDGQIYAMLFRFATLDIDPFATEQEVREKTEEALRGEIDFSFYQNFKSAQSVPGGGENGFGLYSFLWYNTKGDIPLGNAISLYVLDNGEMGGLRMCNKAGNSYDHLKENLSAEQFLPEIEEAVREIYAEDLTDWRLQSSRIATYREQCYLYCQIGVSLKSGWNEACELLIRID